MQKTRGVCLKCMDTKFYVNGVAVVRGTKTFTCVNCLEDSGTFVEGQCVLCHRCAEKLKLCAMCGKPYSKEYMDGI